MRNLLIIIGGMALILAQTAEAANVTFFTTASLWQAQTYSIQSLGTLSSDVGLAEEVGNPSGTDVLLGNTLTFLSATTGLSRSFNLKTLQSGAQFVFNDSTGIWQNSLSVGTHDVYEDDDWELNFLSGPALSSFAFELVNNDEGTSDSYSIYGAGNVLLATLSGTSIPTSVGDTTRFLGVVSDINITRIVYNDDTGGDDIGIRNMQFGFAVPEPQTLFLFSLALLGVSYLKRK